MQPAARSQSDTARLNVFISYSRADAAFANDLVLGLAACGFAPYIDRRDIAAGEDWAQRLSGLIRDADSVVFVVSPDSVRSTHCGEELAEAVRLSKRILPVVWRPVPDEAAPRELTRLNYIFFTGEGRSFAGGLSDLATALRTDLDWIREHTRLAALAQRWIDRDRPATLLLRGDDIDAARAWMSGKPMGSVEVTDRQAEFVKASADARTAEDRRARQARQGLLAAVSAVALAMTGLAVFAGLQWKTAGENGMRAQAALKDLQASSERERAAQLRLNLPIGLRVAANASGQFYAAPGWYRFVSDFFGALVQVKRVGGGQPGQISGGMLIEGGLVQTRYAGEMLLLVPAGRLEGDTPPLVGAPAPAGFPPPGAISVAAPGDTLAPGAPSQPQGMLDLTPQSGPIRLEIAYTSLEGERSGSAAERVWRTPVEMGAVFPFEIWRLSAPAPTGARAIGEGDISCISLEGAPAGRSIGQFTAPFPAADGKRGPATIDVAALQDMSDPYKILYGHGTSRVSGGSPVFDFATSKAFAVHIGSEPDPGDTRLRRGYGVSLPLVLNMARSKLADATFHPPPLCQR